MHNVTTSRRSRAPFITKCAGKMLNCRRLQRVEACPENCALTLRKEAAKIARRKSGDDDLPEPRSSERQASIVSLDGKDVINHGRVVGVALRPFRPLKTRRALRLYLSCHKLERGSDVSRVI